jgi:hypothetical protein
VLTQARAAGLITKSNLILGMGEEPEEVVQALQDLHDAGTDIITITQYLRPSPRHLPVARWVKPDEFVEFKQEAERIGFLGVLAGPLVRSSYRAGRLWAQSMVAKGREIPTHLSHLADADWASRKRCERGPRRSSVGAGDRLHVAVAGQVHEQHFVGGVGSRAYSRTAKGSVPPCSSARIVMLTSCSDRMMSMCVSPEMSTRTSSRSSQRLLLLQEVLGDLAGAVVELGHHGVAGLQVDLLEREIMAAATSSAAAETSS